MTATPLAIALFVCKTVLLPEVDPNAEFTKVENRAWAVENGQMICRRLVMPMHDEAAEMGAKPVTPNMFDKSVCARLGIPIGVKWDADNKSSNYRFFRIGCPTPTVNLETGKIVNWTLPSCPASGPNGPILCEQDSAI